MTLRVSIIGLGRIGTSIGLALKQSELDLHIVGHDKEPSHTREARRRHAIDKGEWNLPRSVEGADLVILALPLSAIRETLTYIAEDVRPNAVIMDTAPLKVPVLRWAEEILPANVHFVGGHPIVRDIAPGQEHARADLFQGEIFTLCTTPSAHPDAVRLASGVVEMLGARLLFLDPGEHDSMMAAVDVLPQLVGLVLGHTVATEPSWREMRKLAGAQFEASTFLSATTPEEVATLFVENREALATWLRMFRRALERWQELVERGDTEAIAEAARALVDIREAWIAAAQSGMWDVRPEERQRAASFSTWMFGESLARLLRSGK